MFEESSDEAENDLYGKWIDLRDNASEKEVKLVNCLLGQLINFAEEYPDTQILQVLQNLETLTGNYQNR